jgi:D-alanyl-D-alanine carboxypeptidase
VVRSAKSAVQAINYPRAGDTATFRLRAFITQGSTTVEAVVITARTEATGVGTFAIDSISPAEASGTGGLDPFCRPRRNWGSWSTIATTFPLQALSRQGGQITITKAVPVPNGLAIGGRFLFTARRLDLYDDPLGSLPVRGTFVAPLVAATSRCTP